MTTSSKTVNLALQGGGAHGAFTWGVMDRLLEDGRVHFEGVSGTSAGAMNAVVLADGYLQGGVDGARQALHDFWMAAAAEGTRSPIQRNPINRLLNDWSLDNSWTYQYFDSLSRVVSPYQLNPLNLNPLRGLLDAQVDFDRVRHCTAMKLFISATNVHTGRVRVFDTTELTADVVMASACLPMLFHAVEIDGVPYWDGGFMGNPVMFPFFDSCGSRDVLLIQINPIERTSTPRSARDIINRLNEITANSSLMKELRAIEFVSRLIDQGKLDPGEYRQVLLHRVYDDELERLSASSKLNAESAFLEYLRDLGREAAQRWLDSCFEHVGQRSSVDLRTEFF
jgi:NTE family protein